MAQGLDLSNYSIPLVTRIANALRIGFGARFKVVYEGDPFDIPAVNLPCIIVQKTGGTVQQDATGLDEVKSSITVKIVMNMRADFGSTDEKTVTHNFLTQNLEGRDPISLQYSPQSVMGIIRTNFTVGQTIVDQQVNLDYQVGFRPKDLVSTEAWAKFSFTELILIPNRT